MTTLPDTARALIESGRLAHCVTLNEDGSPQVSVVWIGLDGDEIVMAHIPQNRKVRNLRRDPRIVLSLDSPTATRSACSTISSSTGRQR